MARFFSSHPGVAARVLGKFGGFPSRASASDRGKKKGSRTFNRSRQRGLGERPRSNSRWDTFRTTDLLPPLQSFPENTGREESSYGGPNYTPVSRHSLMQPPTGTPGRSRHRSEDRSPRPRSNRESRRATSTGGRLQEARQVLWRTKDKLDNDVEDLAGQLTRASGGPVPSYRLQMLEFDWKEARNQQKEVWQAFDRCITLTEATDKAKTR